MSDSAMPVAPARVPVATYRLQLHDGCTFADAAGLVPYLRDLGVTDLYASPVLTARPGSTHGYDVCDPTRLNPALGGDEAFAMLAAALARHRLGVVLDVVPNHMAADPRHNPWWRDVLTHGESSAYASCFDIDWHRPGTEGRVLVPILGDELDRVRARGEIRLVAEDGACWLAYFDHRVPVDPARAGLDASDPARLAAEVDDVGARASDGAPTPLDRLLAAAPLKLAHWRTAARELNYRRFFDITELVGLRVEDPTVFDATHARVLALVRDAPVTGLRIDHPDGLRDPAGYLALLQDAVGAAGGGPRWIVVEKILSPGEALPLTWQTAVHGTTGYNFLNDLNGLFVDPAAEAPLRATYHRLTGSDAAVDDLVHAAKCEVLDGALAVELEGLADRLARLPGEWDRDTARRVLRALIAAFPTYRAYVTAAGASDADRAMVDAAVDAATRRYPEDGGRLAAVGRLLAREATGDDVIELVMRLQQLTGPAQAKGLEDTTCYRYPVLLSLNEVGGEPGRFDRNVGGFHRAAAARQTDWPLEMLATSTHDTKRGEDARARINVLSELPEAWDEAVADWVARNTPARRVLDGRPAPAPSDEYLYYQTLIGVWPPAPDDTPVPAAADPSVVERVAAFMRKAIREAKQRTSWLDPDAAYEAAVDTFVRGTLGGETAPAFLGAFVPFQRRVAGHGVVNALAQLVLKIAAPGVPDFYQGTELWDHSLVDPDNRRPVDFVHRRRTLAALAPWLVSDANAHEVEAAASRLLDRAWDGAVKLFVTARGLAHRRVRRDLLLWGDYTPLAVDGPRAAHVVAFARRHGDDTLVAVAPRLTCAVGGGVGPYPLGAVWGETAVRLPGGAPRRYTQVLTGVDVAAEEGRLSVADLFRTLPVALLSA